MSAALPTVRHANPGAPIGHADRDAVVSADPRVDLHRSFIADLPQLSGDAARVPENLRAALLQKEFDRLAESNYALRAVVLELMELAKDQPELLARARAAYLRAAL